VSGDSTFNELFVTALEHEGVQCWMQSHGAPLAVDAYRVSRRRNALVASLREHRLLLVQTYRNSQSRDEAIQAKCAVFVNLRVEHELVKRNSANGLFGDGGYDLFFAGELNNAPRTGAAIDAEMLPEFGKLLQDDRGHLKAFIDDLQRIAKLPKDQRDARVATLYGEMEIAG